MLSNLQVSLAAVLPMFILIAVGVLIRRVGLIDDASIKKVNGLVFYVFGSCMMFNNIYGKEISEVFDARVITFVCIGLLIVYAVCYVLCTSIEKNPYNTGAFLHGTFRSNTMLMGLPLAMNILGADNVGLVSVAITVIVPIQNILAVFTMEMFRGGKVKAGKILKGIITNPFIIGAGVGFLCNVLNIVVPKVIVSPIASLGGVTSTLAMVTLGATFNFKNVGECKRDLIIAIIMRLVIIPGAALVAAVMMGFTGAGLVTVIAIFASPTAVMTFTMAQQMNSNATLAGNIVVFTSMLSAFTIFLSVFILNSMGLIYV